MGQEPLRSQMFAFINSDLFFRLPVIATPIDQVRGDLLELNRIDFLENYEVPLRDWLEEGTANMATAPSKQRRTFQDALKKVTLKSQEIIAEAENLPPPNVAVADGEGEEKVVLRNDMLDIGWLDGAKAVSSSVARLAVTRYENGAVARLNSGRPRVSFGTGWLVGPRHIMTNHHVINFRSGSEGLAGEADLELQASNAVVQFDFDIFGEEGQKMGVKRLSAWNRRGKSPWLDYAILELEEPVANRVPLTLAPHAVSSLGSEEIVPLNIIQHPGGNPKMLGIRNNLAHRIDDFEVSYFTDTEGGSSGSPVCNDKWQVIALHKKFSRFVNEKIMFQGQSTAWENRGTLIRKIIDDLETNHADLWAEIGATVI
jgi:V8-like Glu-specific endopeptidase